MKKLNLLALSIQTALFAGAISSFSATAADTNTTNELEEEKVERVVVTGSRIRKAEFSSASPVQVISGDLSRELGVFNAAEMLQSSSQAAGSQIDSSFGGFVLDNGPGATTIGFRGLGADRTLVLVNGRRMVPAGVGGAPTSTDLSLVPAVMIDRIDNLFDGASTVYGSDAIAGVSNAILRTDVEGFDVQGSYNQPKSDGGVETTLSAMYGNTFDNGFVTVGVEYYEQKHQTMGQNEFTSGCNEYLYDTKDGRRLTQNRTTGPSKDAYGNCNVFPLTNRVSFGNFWGSLYYTPGKTNTGLPNFSETTVPKAWIGLADNWVGGDSDGDGIIDTGFVDGDGDGNLDVSFLDPFWAYSLSEEAKKRHLVNATKRYSIMINGDYDFKDNNNTKVYYEALWAKRESPSYTPGGQMFPSVSATNPFNPCGTNGIDCGAIVDPDFATGPVTAQPILNIHGDRDRLEIAVSQYRLVTGVTGDLGILDNFGSGNWYYDAYASYSASSGDDSRQGISAERLHHSLDTSVKNADGSITCGNGSDGCVPVNLFGENLYQLGGGHFTQAEADYLFVDRVMKTDIKQTIFNGFIAGDLYTLPWNSEVISAVFGAEFRKDEIDSDPNDIAAKGGLENYFSDKGARGSRNMREFFVEFEAPLVRGRKYAEELTLTASGRWTDESFYDPSTTYSLKAIYRPVEWATIRGTKGTSYRAPNLRERFILGTSGFNSPGDACVVPDDARIANPNDPNGAKGYDPTKDLREAHVFSSCIANGVDPYSLGNGIGENNFTSNYSAEIEKSGTTKLNPETSVAKTYGFVLEQPFSEDFDLTLSVTRFDIEIENSIAEPSAGYVTSQCYENSERPNGDSGFCDLITRDASTGRMSLIRPGFINVGYESSKGYDYNIYYEQDILLGDKALGVSVDLQATKMTEQAYDILGDADDNVGEVTTPEWRGTARLRLKYDDFRFNWQARYIGGGELDNPPEWKTTHAPCKGLIENGEAVECRAVYYTDSYVVHNASLNWSQDNYSLTFGLENVFNEAPPKVDYDAGPFNTRNIPLGVGYDFFGRTAFLSFGVKF